MKIVDEKFTSPKNKEVHYDKHIVHRKEYKVDADEYEDRAEQLAKSRVDYKNILGYISRYEDKEHHIKQAYCKYNKETQECTYYTYRHGEPATITMYKKSWKDYNGDKARDYFDEIPEGK